MEGWNLVMSTTKAKIMPGVWKEQRLIKRHGPRSGLEELTTAGHGILSVAVGELTSYSISYYLDVADIYLGNFACWLCEGSIHENSAILLAVLYQFTEDGVTEICRALDAITIGFNCSQPEEAPPDLRSFLTPYEHDRVQSIGTSRKLRHTFLAPQVNMLFCLKALAQCSLLPSPPDDS